MIFQSTTFRFTHDITYLLELISQKDSGFESYYDTISELQGYAVEIRYQNETVFLSIEKVENALLIAKNVRQLVTQRMNMTIEYNEIIDN